MKAEDLYLVQESKLLVKYKLGECFGELALLHNTRRLETTHVTEDGEWSGERVMQSVHCVHCDVFLLASTLVHPCRTDQTRPGQERPGQARPDQVGEGQKRGCV